MTTRRYDLLTYAMLGGAVLFWAGNSIVGRAVRNDIDPISLSLLRWIGATLVVAPLALPHLRTDWPKIREGWKATAIICLAGIAGFNTLLYAGLAQTLATNALLIQAAIPGLVLILGALALGQKEPRMKVLGIVLSVLGAAFTVFRGSIDAVLGLELGKGDPLVLAACVTWAIYTLSLQFAPKVRPASFLFVTFLGGALVLSVVAMVVPGRHFEWSTGAALGVGYTGVFPSVLAYFFYNAAVARAGPAQAGQAIAMMPIIGALLAALLLAEPLHWYHAVGMTMIVAGIVIAARAHPQPR
ncbi:DMT family transporter [Croceicoccus naphthovorans]|uniref:EamA domain-containing protein n=1 Tax=Croceicoccus naphthovorans TaxID=1348774 RepID=A0A0G3XGD7_9SPHN|nr:DMT family transporter [Croceicoccus naphthovorans]AKM09674.1 hypothetical protein AB433_06255 [Croceicoccus naphthovorans]MBB3990799.1 drug/metabolite transporter (DMT)-like permease [Croceicoccus naphthovorans]